MKISVVMANYQGAAYLDDAISSVLRQGHQDFELLIADDNSNDDSIRIISQWQARDSRVVGLTADHNQGAAASRNRCIEAAQGDWLAIVDSDDVLHPDRLARMLAVAVQTGSDFVADDMVFFSGTHVDVGRTLLETFALTAPRPISALDMLKSDVPAQKLPALGYLKPLIARDAVGSLRYDETLSVAEDFDFYLRVLMGGAKALILPEPMYGYRRHSHSLSHRLSVSTVERMIAAQDAFSQAAPPEMWDMLNQRAAGLHHKLAYEQLVAAIKARRVSAAIGMVLRRPGLLRDLAQSVSERMDRKASDTPDQSPLILCLGAGDGVCDRSIAFPDVPPPGGTWTQPLAPIAAELSSLSARHCLDVQAYGESGLWALWMLPCWQSAGLHDLDHPSLPIPDGVRVVPTQ